MNVYQIVFSPTGGTKQVADFITKAWEMPDSEIDLTNAETDFAAFGLKKR